MYIMKHKIKLNPVKINHAILNVKALSHTPKLNLMSSFILKVISTQTHTNPFLHSPP